MGRNLVPRVPILLSLSTLDDEAIHLLASDIQAAAPTSKLVAANPAMATSVAQIKAKDAVLATSNKEVDDDRVKLHTDIATEAEARSDLLGELRTYANFATSGAKTAADVHGTGLKSRDVTTSKLPPAAPGSIDNKPPIKGHGLTIVSVHETGPTRYHYVAEQSFDGNTWTQLGVGHGKTRRVTGTSGTKVWVRFATVRGQLQSEWSTPILVTIP